MTAVFIIGLAVALIYAEITGFVPGGLIVPAYLALYFDQPGRAAATLAAALLALGAYRLAAARLLIVGRRRFAFLLLAGALIGQAWLLLWPRLLAAPFDLRVIGWVVPGLIANSLARQKFWLTLASIATASGATFALVEIWEVLGR
jgi:poly-gamma-glutamate biosynthesis protein PgsC/CapC